MIEADDARNLPYATRVSPKMDELCVAAITGLRAGRVETVDANLHSTVVLQGIHFEASRNQIPHHFTADILFHCFGEILGTHHQSRLIVVELDAVSEKSSKLGQVTAVVGVEKRCIQRRNGPEQRSVARRSVRTLRAGGR